MLAEHPNKCWLHQNRNLKKPIMWFWYSSVPCICYKLGVRTGGPVGFQLNLVVSMHPKGDVNLGLFWDVRIGPWSQVPPTVTSIWKFLLPTRLKLLQWPLPRFIISFRVERSRMRQAPQPQSPSFFNKQMVKRKGARASYRLKEAQPMTELWSLHLAY